MTEERRVQLGVTIDATGANAGLEQIKHGARDMAQVVGQAGQAAGKGMDAIGDGAKRSADAMNREEGRMRAAIQRATLDLKTLGATASEKLEAKISLQGLDASKLQPYIAALKQVEEAQRSVQQKQQASTAANSFTDGLRAQIAALREQVHLQSLSADEALRYKAAQAGAADSAAPLILQLRNMRAAQEAVAQSARDQAAAQKTAAAAVSSRTSFVDNLKQQSDAIGKTRVDLLEMQAAQMGVASAAAPYIAKLRESEKGHLAFASGAKLNAFQVQQLGFQMHDFAVQVFSGQSALTAFVQQGSQLSGTFGGAGNALKAVLGLITPVRAALIGVAAAAGGLGLALSHAETAARGLATVQAQLAGTGRSDLFSTEELRAFIKELALAPGVTREVATGIVSELSKVKDIGDDVFRDLGRSVAGFAKATGTDAATAARTLAQAVAEPEKGFATLSKTISGMSSLQRVLIEDMARMGNTAGAQRALADALKNALKGVADTGTTPLKTSVNELGNAWDAAMDKMSQAEGLRNINTLLAKTVELVTWLVNNSGKLANLGNVGIGNVSVGQLPGGAGGLIAAGMASVDATARLFGGASDKSALPTGNFARTDRTAATAAIAAASGSASQASKDADDLINKGLDIAKAHSGVAAEIARETQKRDVLNKALAESVRLYGTDSKAAKLQQSELRSGIAGVNEKIASIKKRGQGGANEPQQVLDAQLQQSLKASRDALESEQANMAFAQRFLQGEYQAGNIALRDYYDEQRKSIEQGVAAKFAALDKERIAVQAHLEATKKTSPKDKSAIVTDETRLKEIDAQAGKLRIDGARAQTLASQDETAATKALNEEVLNYRANLRQLAGDEAGAARIRSQIADEQDRLLAFRASKSANPISAEEQAAAKQQRADLIALNDAKTKTSQINQVLQIEEERIGLAMRTGAVGEIAALGQIGAARSKAVAELEKIVKAQEEVAKSRPQDYQLQIDTSRARLELDKLKAELDPLKEKFDNLFKDTGASFFEDLMNGVKPKDALRNFASSISKEFSSIASKELSQQVFGKDGIFGGLGGIFADNFGGKDRNKPALDTSGVTASFNRLEAGGINPTISAFSRLIASIDSASGALGNSGPSGSGNGFDSTALPTGDFARMDRGQTSGEDSVMNLFRDAGSSSQEFAKTNTYASNAVMQMANAAAKGGGALGLLPRVIQAFEAAVQSMRLSGGGGGGGGMLGSLFGGGGSSFAAGGSASSGFGSGAAFGNMDLGLFLSDGGYTGDIDPKKPAGIVHGKEFVFSEPAVRAIGVERLERMHKRAKSGEMDLPGYSDGGYVTVLGSARPMQRSQWGAPVKDATARAGDTFHVNVTAAPGVTREQAMNQGRDIGRGIQANMGRRARNT
jgi:phage-related minor tail protein